MKPLRFVAWIMLAVWASWITAVQAVAVSKTFLGAWTPDLSLLLVIGCAMRLHKRDVVPATVVIALARTAYSVEPPVAVLAGTLGVATLLRGIRRMAEIERPVFSVSLGALCALGFSLWLVTVHALRARLELSPALVAALPSVVQTTITTATCALFAGGFVFLPGLSPLRKRRW